MENKAKNKANELIERFMDGIPIRVNPKYTIKEIEKQFDLDYQVSRVMAIKCCDEIIAALAKADTAYDLLKYLDFWQQVRKEIINHKI